MPFSPFILFVFIFSLLLLIIFVQFGVISIVFEKLGLSQSSAYTLLVASLIGSMINLPLFSIKSKTKKTQDIPYYYGFLREYFKKYRDKTVITVNVGGALIPVAFSIYLFQNNPIIWPETFFAIMIMTAISYGVSRPIHGIGIGMPVFIAPICAALIAVIINPEYSAPLAYICGSVGVLLGADIFRINSIKQMELIVASIGGAGTFDGIFITGIIAVLLA